MKTLSDVVGSHGGAIEFTTKTGKKLKIQPLNLKLMSKFEKHLETKAIETCMKLKDLDPNLFVSAFSQVSKDITTGMYAFGGEIATKSLQSSSGITKLVSLMCNVDDAEAAQIMLDEGDAFRDVLDLAVKQSMPESDENPQSAQSQQA